MLTFSPEDVGDFDRVLLIPLLTDGLDVSMVLQALRFVRRPGGRLVALCANGREQATLLQPLAVTSGGHWEPIHGTAADLALLSVHR